MVCVGTIRVRTGFTLLSTGPTVETALIPCQQLRQLRDIRRLLLEPIHIAPDCDDDHKIQHHILDADHRNSLSCALSVTHHFLRLGLGLHAHDHALERSRGKYLVWRADLSSPRDHQQLGVGH